MKKNITTIAILSCLLIGGLTAQTANEGSTRDKDVNTNNDYAKGNCTLKAGSSSICEDVGENACQKGETWMTLCKDGAPGQRCEQKTYQVPKVDGWCKKASSGQCGVCQWDPSGP